MKFETPKIYTQPRESGDFSGFDREYEQVNMGKLVAKGWPINWNYVTKDNITSVCAGLVQRTITVDISTISKQAKDTMNSLRDKAVILMSSNLRQRDQNTDTTSYEA